MFSDKVWSKVDELRALNKPVSLEDITDSYINSHDFAAVKEFQDKNPELYIDAIATPEDLDEEDMIAHQMAAFNWLFKYHKKELQSYM